MKEGKWGKDSEMVVGGFGEEVVTAWRWVMGEDRWDASGEMGLISHRS